MIGVQRYTQGSIGMRVSKDGEHVLASDYDRDTQSLKDELDNIKRSWGLLHSERDELRAQVEAMRAALENAAKGILWLQASVPMSLRISKRASKDYNAAKRAALQEDKT